MVVLLKEFWISVPSLFGNGGFWVSVLKTNCGKIDSEPKGCYLPVRALSRDFFVRTSCPSWDHELVSIHFLTLDKLLRRDYNNRDAQQQLVGDVAYFGSKLHVTVNFLENVNLSSEFILFPISNRLNVVTYCISSTSLGFCSPIGGPDSTWKFPNNLVSQFDLFKPVYGKMQNR